MSAGFTATTSVFRHCHCRSPRSSGEFVAGLYAAPPPTWNPGHVSSGFHRSTKPLGDESLVTQSISKASGFLTAPPDTGTGTHDPHFACASATAGSVVVLESGRNA